MRHNLPVNEFKLTPKIDKIYEVSIVNPFSIGENIEPVDSSRVGFYMDTRLVFVSALCNSLMLRNYLNHNNASLAILHCKEKITGIVTKEILESRQDSLLCASAGSYAIPWDKVLTIKYHSPIEKAARMFAKGIQRLVVLYHNRPVGVLNRNDIPWINCKNSGINYSDISNLNIVLDHLPENIIVLDENQNIIFFNKQVLNLLSKTKCNIRGRKFEEVFGHLFAKSHKEFRAQYHLEQVILNHTPMYNIECKSVKGNTYLMSVIPIVRNKSRYLAVCLRDISLLKEQEKEEKEFRDDLIHVFRLMLPDKKIENMLKCIPEYRDCFCHESGLIKIKGIIPDGGYRHVINCLKIASELNDKGIFDIMKIDRNTIIQTLITHDIGKNQPKLEIGDMLNPKEAFTDGKIHAAESARMISEFPSVSDDVITLVRYHHHAENELPGDFPERLLLQLRLVQLIDGLSAGLTRKNAKLSITVDHNKIIIFEKNPNSRYNGVKEVDLLTGEQLFYPL